MSTFDTNLAALRTLSPTLANLLETTPIPPAFLPTQGTDATPTFSCTLPGPPKSIEWLGHTSMPLRSALPLINHLDAASNGANGLALSIGTGFEWLAFLHKLPNSQMLFIYEPDPALLRMALDICDMAEPLRTARIILLSGPPNTASDALIALLTSHPGIEPPTVMHPLPTLTGDRRNTLLTGGEAIVRAAVAHRQTRVNAAAELLAQRIHHLTASGKWPTTPAAWQLANPVPFLLAPRYTGERPLHAELQKITPQTPPITVSRYDTISLLLRLETLCDALQTAPARILSDLFRHQLTGIPAEIPVETWVAPLVAPAFWHRLPTPDTLQPLDRIVIHSDFHREQFLSRHFPAHQLDLRPFRRATTAPVPTAPITPRHRVALIADLPATDTQSLDLALPTHQAIHKAAAELIIADYLTIHPGMAADLYRRALSRAGIDPAQREKSLEAALLPLLRDALIPALPLLTLVETLLSQGIPLTLIGHWPGLESHLAASPPDQIKRIPFAQYQPEVWQDIALVAHLSPQGIISPILFDALALGIPLIAPRHPTDHLTGSLATTLPQTPFAHPQPQHFLTTLKSLLRSPPGMSKRTEH